MAVRPRTKRRPRSSSTGATALPADKESILMAALDNVRLSHEGNVPSFGGATGWLNSEPLTAADLRGHVVLVDFWTFTCINWIRTAPYLRAWDAKYRDHGLIVIGVHTPEFPFETTSTASGRSLRSGGSRTQSPSTATMRSGAPSLTGIGPRCTSPMPRERFASTTSVRVATTSQSEPFRSCSTFPAVPSATSSSSRQRATRQRPTGTPCSLPRPTSAPNGPSGSPPRAEQRGTGRGPTAHPIRCGSTNGPSPANGSSAARRHD